MGSKHSLPTTQSKSHSYSLPKAYKIGTVFCFEAIYHQISSSARVINQESIVPDISGIINLIDCINSQARATAARLLKFCQKRCMQRVLLRWIMEGSIIYGGFHFTFAFSVGKHPLYVTYYNYTESACPIYNWMCRFASHRKNLVLWRKKCGLLVNDKRCPVCFGFKGNAAGIYQRMVCGVPPANMFQW